MRTSDLNAVSELFSYSKKGSGPSSREYAYKQAEICCEQYLKKMNVKPAGSDSVVLYMRLGDKLANVDHIYFHAFYLALKDVMQYSREFNDRRRALTKGGEPSGGEEESNEVYNLTKQIPDTVSVSRRPELIIVTAINFGTWLQNETGMLTLKYPFDERLAALSVAHLELMASLSPLPVRIMSNFDVDKDFCYAATADHLVAHSTGKFAVMLRTLHDSRMKIKTRGQTGG